MRPLLLSLSCCLTAFAAEPPVLQKNDFPVVVSIRCTDIKAEPDDLHALPGLAHQIIPLLKDYGYVQSRNDDLDQFYQTFLSTDDPRFPKYIHLRKRAENGVIYFDVSTRGDLTPEGYSGHSDDFTFWVVTQIKPLINTKR